jgi:hypothetical protein
MVVDATVFPGADSELGTEQETAGRSHVDGSLGYLQQFFLEHRNGSFLLLLLFCWINLCCCCFVGLILSPETLTDRTRSPGYGWSTWS